MTVRANKFNYIDKSSKLGQVMNADLFENDNYSQFALIGFGALNCCNCNKKMNKTH